MMEICWLWC